MSIVVFWLETHKKTGESKSMHKKFTDKELSLAIKFGESLRKNQNGDEIEVFSHHITTSPEMSDMVGKYGVDSVENGKTPDGVEYSWVKRRPPDIKK